MKTKYSLILMAIILTSFQIQEAELGLKLEEAKEYRQATQSNTIVIQHVQGQEIKTEMVIKGTMVFLVKSADQDQYDLEAHYEKLSMSMQMPQGAMALSSEDESNQNIFSQVMAAIVDKPFNVIMGKKGEVRDVQHVEELWENAINQFDNLPEMQKEQIKSQMMNTYGNKALKTNIEMITKVFPDNAVNIGDEWAVRTNLESGIQASVDTQYRLTDITDDDVLIN